MSTFLRTPHLRTPGPRQMLFAAAAALAAFGFTAAAQAGSCPADKQVAEGKGQPMSQAPAAKVTDNVLTMIDLSKESVAIKDRQMRLRRLVVQPGGVVPWHSHGDRPALIYIMSGEITEYASTCAVPIVHRADRAPCRGSRAGIARAGALVEELRQPARGSALGGSLSYAARPAHDVISPPRGVRDARHAPRVWPIRWVRRALHPAEPVLSWGAS